MTGNDNDGLAGVTFGVEEELFLIDPESRDLVTDPDPAAFAAFEAEAAPHKVVRELLRSQVEINTRVCKSVAEVRRALTELRGTVAHVAGRYGMAVLAASTHPFALPGLQKTTEKDRYQALVLAYQDLVRRFLVGGMHVHVGIEDPDRRIRVMTALRRYLPVFLALSASSPFYEGRDTGYKSWRLTPVGSLPRTGVPRPIGSMDEYDRLLEVYRRCKFLRDGSELWWDIRPSHTYPTLELRVCDVCTKIDDAVCMVALLAALVRMVIRKDGAGCLPEEPLTEIIEANKWAARRYGVFAFVADGHAGTDRPDLEEYLATLVEELAEDAEALACESELLRVFRILREGSSADMQSDLYRLRRLDGDSHEAALVAVVDHLVMQSRDGSA